MRIRSCQLVYLLLLLCSVQGLETRVLSAVASGPATLSAQGESRPVCSSPGLGHPAADAYVATEASTPRPQPLAPPAADAARHASAVATFTSFTRG